MGGMKRRKRRGGEVKRERSEERYNTGEEKEKKKISGEGESQAFFVARRDRSPARDVLLT